MRIAPSLVSQRVVAKHQRKQSPHGIAGKEKSMEKLKPCPFCGEQEFVSLVRSLNGVVAWVDCNNCGCYGPAKNTEAEVKMILAYFWNRYVSNMKIIVARASNRFGQWKQKSIRDGKKKKRA